MTYAEAQEALQDGSMIRRPSWPVDRIMVIRDGVQNFEPDAGEREAIDFEEFSNPQVAVFG